MGVERQKQEQVRESSICLWTETIGINCERPKSHRSGEEKNRSEEATIRALPGVEGIDVGPSVGSTEPNTDQGRTPLQSHLHAYITAKSICWTPTGGELTRSSKRA